MRISVLKCFSSAITNVSVLKCSSIAITNILVIAILKHFNIEVHINRSLSGKGTVRL